MYTTRNPAHRIQSPQIGSAGWDALYEASFASSVSPEEFFNSGVSLAAVCPETALMYAVLEDAYLCFQKRSETDIRSIQQALEAEEWFFSDDSYALFSFVSICTVLGLEPEFIRKGLKHRGQSHLDTPQRKLSKMERVTEGRPRPRFGDSNRRKVSWRWK
jgi:hypothetical protein